MKQNTVLKILISTAIVLLIIFLAALYLFTPQERLSVGTHVKIADYHGINLDRDAMHFGTLPPGGESWRKMNISTTGPRHVVVNIYDDQNWISTRYKTFELDGSREIKFIINIPEDAQTGNYTGIVEILFYPPLSRLVLP